MLLVKIRPVAAHRVSPQQIQLFIVGQGDVFHRRPSIGYSNFGFRTCFGFRISDFGFLSGRTLPPAAQLKHSPRQQFNQATQDLVSILAVESQRQLGREQAVFDTDVITVPFEFTRQITFAFGQLCQRS